MKLTVFIHSVYLFPNHLMLNYVLGNVIAMKIYFDKNSSL